MIAKQRVSDSQLLNSDANVWSKVVSVPRAANGDELKVSYISQDWGEFLNTVLSVLEVKKNRFILFTKFKIYVLKFTFQNRVDFNSIAHVQLSLQHQQKILCILMYDHI